ncbi:pseudaminic acid biosynthesis-associated methylase [uncultured Maricaulis sp.]|uniref:pseudaminic acid biosynthesis-associated methylase n=1 Tax=uncultured Maricaulis sp. TaxID=174710 RepID=UPI0030D904EC|tara:strand:+ start:36662 stop:37294 length:633 start_codon:yes stop_codon:yes gene_type:complete
MTDTTQLDAWQGEFGDQYVNRNAPLTEQLRARTRMWARMMRGMAGAEPETILEVGCNIGLNLRSLDRLTGAELHGIEPNDKARESLLRDQVLRAENLHKATAQKIPYGDASIDLVFTSGVLIHIHPDHLEAAADEMHRVSRRWLLVSEYFSSKPENIPYRGRDDLLFKRDFGSFFLDRFNDLEVVDDGFLWQRTTGIDNTTWVLFRKKGR